MGGNKRRGVIKVLGAAGLGAALLAFAAIGASAMIPKPGTIRIADGYTFKNLTGYQSPGAGTNCNAYAPNTPFSFHVDVTNGFGARDQKFNVQVFKMADLNASTCYTEAQLEAMVQTGHNATETGVYGTDEAGNTQSYHFEYGTTNTVVGGTTLPACGYYQFDMGLPNTGSFAPRPGTSSSDTGPVSGFVLYSGCSSTGGVSGGGTSGSTATNSGGVAAASAAKLANTGSGPAPLAFLVLAMLGASILIGGVRLAYTGRRPE